MTAGAIISELNRAKVLFQQRALLAALDITVSGRTEGLVSIPTGTSPQDLSSLPANFQQPLADSERSNACGAATAHHRKDQLRAGGVRFIERMNGGQVGKVFVSIHTSKNT